MVILEDYPKSKHDFMLYMVTEYATDGKLFAQAPLIERYRVILRWLGQSVDLPEKMPLIDLESKINSYLCIYEDLLVRYPQGMDDPLKIINEMDHDERIKKFPELYRKKDIFIGMSMALIDYDFTKDANLKLRVTLSQALVDIESESKDYEEEYSFLTPNTLQNEEVPF